MEINKLFLARLRIRDISLVMSASITSRQNLSWVMSSGSSASNPLHPGQLRLKEYYRIENRKKKGIDQTLACQSAPSCGCSSWKTAGQTSQEAGEGSILPGSLWVDAPGRLCLVPSLFEYMVLCHIEDGFFVMNGERVHSAR